MRSTYRAGVTAAVAAAVTATIGIGAAAASPSTIHSNADSHSNVVFVQNQATDGNTVFAYDRAADGALSLAGSFATGGVGGALTGAVVDRSASQGSLVADLANNELYAVNAGSNTLSVFAVHGDQLQLRQVIDSGGSFPVSVTTRGDAVYVLDARDGGAIQGYRNNDGRLVRIPARHRDLGLTPVTGSGEFTHTPGQVAFTPDGKHLVVTTKAASNSILVYGIGAAGQPSSAPTVRAENGTVPFAVAFDSRNNLEIADAGTNAVSNYSIADNGVLTLLGTTATGQAATCWIAASGDLLAASNAGSASVTTLTATAGAPTSVGNTGTGAGTVDASFTPDGDFLYVQGGKNGEVDAFAVTGSTLTALGSVTVPNAAGGEGVVAW
jgi:6-phosphogluconolactonase (cycloisomerase 2 family)